MAHFAAGPCLGLAIVVRDQAGRGEDFGPQRQFVRADQVLHHRVRVPHRLIQRQASDRADMQFELAGRAGVDGPVAGIMRARGDLVDQHRASA